MIFAIIIGIFYFRQAKEARLNGIFWALVGALSFILGQILIGFISGFIIAATGNYSLADNFGFTLIIGLFGGLLGVAVSHYFLRKAKKEESKNKPNSDIIDDDF